MQLLCYPWQVHSGIAITRHAVPIVSKDSCNNYYKAVFRNHSCTYIRIYKAESVPILHKIGYICSFLKNAISSRFKSACLKTSSRHHFWEPCTFYRRERGHATGWPPKDTFYMRSAWYFLACFSICNCGCWTCLQYKLTWKGCTAYQQDVNRSDEPAQQFM